MLMKEVCTSNVVKCGRETSVLQAASLIAIGTWAISSSSTIRRAKGVPLGIITDRDIVVEVLGNGFDPAKTTVAGIMRKPVVIAASRKTPKRCSSACARTASARARGGP